MFSVIVNKDVFVYRYVFIYNYCSRTKCSKRDGFYEQTRYVKSECDSEAETRLPERDSQQRGNSVREHPSGCRRTNGMKDGKQRSCPTVGGQTARAETKGEASTNEVSERNN